MGALKPFGMKCLYDETLAAAIKRKHVPQRFVGDLHHSSGVLAL